MKGSHCCCIEHGHVVMKRNYWVTGKKIVSTTYLNHFSLLCYEIYFVYLI